MGPTEALDDAEVGQEEREALRAHRSAAIGVDRELPGLDPVLLQALDATVGLTNNESTTALTGHVDESLSDPITAMDLGDLVRLTVSLYNETGHTLEESRLYFDIPASGTGSDGTN